ncbi:MAG: hypothetical protein LUH07_13710 [Lachnospiraceae bacterium]|nr:hypothetical protein [Lachnospiraceae bacterium]
MSDRLINATKNAGVSIVYQIATLIISFVSRTVFIRTLGIEYLGINSLFSEVLNLLSMADLGLGVSMAYSFYAPLASGDKHKISALISFYKKVYNIIAIAITVIGLCITPFIHLIVNTTTEIPYIEVYYLFALGGIVVSYLWVYKTTLITADQKSYIVTAINMIVTVIAGLIKILVLVIWKNYIIYLIVDLFSKFLMNFLASRKADKLYPYIAQKAELDVAEQKSIFSNVSSMFIYKLSSVLLTATDNSIISVLCGTALVGIYSNYNLVTTKLSSFVVLLFTAVTAGVGNIVATESADKRYSVYKQLQGVSFIVSGITAVCYFVLINNLITVWIGSDYSLNEGTIVAITINLYFSVVLQPLQVYRSATGMYQRTKWIMLICAIENLILSIALGELIGITGILLASIISRITTYMLYEPMILFREYFNQNGRVFFTELIKNVIITSVCAIILKKCFTGWSVDSWIMLFVKALIVGIITLAVFIIAYFKDDSLALIYERVKNLFIRR